MYVSNVEIIRDEFDLNSLESIIKCVVILLCLCYIFINQFFKGNGSPREDLTGTYIISSPNARDLIR